MKIKKCDRMQFVIR